MTQLAVIQGGRNDVLPPPHSRLAETELLGAVMIRPDLWPLIRDLVDAADLHVPANRWLFEGFAACYERFGDIDPVVLQQVLRDHGKLEAVGGPTAIGALLDRSGTVANVTHYAEIVREKAARRRLLLAAERLRRIAHDEGLSLSEVMVSVDGEMRAVARDVALESTGGDDVASVAADLEATIVASAEAASEGKSIGFPFGLSPLDDALNGGPWPGDLVTVMGPRGHGKSALALQFALTQVRAGRRGVMYTAEMPQKQCFGRIVAADCGVPYHVQRGGKMGAVDEGRVRDAIARLRGLPLHLVKASGWGVSRIQQHARQLAREHGKLDWVVVDYVQKLRRHADAKTDAEGLSAISGGLKELALELDLVAIQLSQPVTSATRGVPGEMAKRPKMADAKGSGSIADDSDSFLVVFRPAMDSVDAMRKRAAEISVEKAREGDGAGRVVPCQFNGARMRFEEAPMGQGLLGLPGGLDGGLEPRG